MNIAVPPLAWLHSATWLAQSTSKPATSGRGKAVLINDPAPLVLRNYSRGGLVRVIAERRFVYSGIRNTRPYQELSLLNTMYQAGLPVPRGLAGRVSRFGPTYEAAILMEQIPNSEEIHQRLLGQPLTADLWCRIGQLIRQMHDIQVYHHDLNIHNILVDNADKLWLIDFDKCTVKSGHQWKAKNLNRLLRSLQKEQQRCAHYCFDIANWQALAHGYQADIAKASL